MTKKKELTIIERGIIISFHKAGESERAISKKQAIQRQLSIIQLRSTTKQVFLPLLPEVDDPKN